MNTTTTILVSVIVPVVIIIGALFFVRNATGGGRKKQEQAMNLAASGKKARAKILRIDPTGMVINNINIQCWLTFLLEPLDGSPAFQAQKKVVVPQTNMPRVGDMWPAWYEANDPNTFAVGMPDGASPEQIPLFREFGIPHPLDASSQAAPAPDDGPVDELQRLAQMKADGLLTDEEFTAAKAKLLGG